jgi:hypothetical protein
VKHLQYSECKLIVDQNILDCRSGKVGSIDDQAVGQRQLIVGGFANLQNARWHFLWVKVNVSRLPVTHCDYARGYAASIIVKSIDINV